MSIQLSHRIKEDYQRKAQILSAIILFLLLVVIALPLITYTFPPPEKQGVLISFGESTQGGGNDNTLASNSTDEGEAEDSKSKDSPAAAMAGEAGHVTEKGINKQKEFLLSEANNTASLTQNTPTQGNGDTDLDELNKANEKALEAKRIEEEQARQKAKFEETKSKFGNLLKGDGNGDDDKAELVGDPTGEPNATRLDVIKNGKGKIGGGLEDRGVLFEPVIQDNSQKSGRVVVKVCVNERGKVISANYTQKGSTTNDGELRRKAEKAAMSYVFTGGNLAKQCGTITINFLLK